MWKRQLKGVRKCDKMDLDVRNMGQTFLPGETGGFCCAMCDVENYSRVGKRGGCGEWTKMKRDELATRYVIGTEMDGSCGFFLNAAGMRSGNQGGLDWESCFLGCAKRGEGYQKRRGGNAAYGEAAEKAGVVQIVCKGEKND